MLTNSDSRRSAGFCNHEVIIKTARIHMNGRVYDPNLGRFLSVDPVFQFPTNTQSLNPYSYVLNNPLSMTDPTGYSAAGNGSGSCPAGDSTCAGQSQGNNPVSTITYKMGSLTVTATKLANGNYKLSSNDSDLNKVIGKTFSNGGSSSQGAGDALRGNGEEATDHATNTKVATLNSETSGGTAVNFDKQRFAKYLDKHAESGSTGKCAKYVRRALKAGGLDTKGHPVNAGDYGDFLTKLGAVRVAGKGDLKNYHHKVGDIAVFGKNAKHIYGHIAGFDGHHWVSDWKQHAFIPYKDPTGVPSYEIYRFEDSSKESD